MKTIQSFAVRKLKERPTLAGLVKRLPRLLFTSMISTPSFIKFASSQDPGMLYSSEQSMVNFGSTHVMPLQNGVI